MKKEQICMPWYLLDKSLRITSNFTDNLIQVRIPMQELTSKLKIEIFVKCTMRVSRLKWTCYCDVHMPYENTQYIEKEVVILFEVLHIVEIE